MSCRHEKYFGLELTRSHCHKKRRRTYPNPSRSVQRSFAPLLKNRAEITSVFMCEQKPYPVCFSCWRKTYPLWWRHPQFSILWYVKTDAALLVNNSQHWCYMLRPFPHSVACCCVLLGVTARTFETSQNVSNVQTNATTPCWELLANNVASVCTGL